MTHRIISGLAWAAPCDRPSGLSRRRPRGSKGAGLRYERDLARAVGRAVAGATHGQWFHFIDERGKGYCQPDIYWLADGMIYVLECKLTDVDTARSQITQLYAPILEYVFRRPVRGIVAVRHLTRESNRDLVCDSLRMAVTRANGVIPTLHWLGRGAI